MNIDNSKYNISNNYAIYCYSKKGNSLKFQREYLKTICKSMFKMPPSKIYSDSGVSNFVRDKSNLKKLLEENSNIDVVVLSADRLTRDSLEMLEIESYAKTKNIRFFSIRENKFLFESEYEKNYLDLIKNIKDGDFEL